MSVLFFFLAIIFFLIFLFLIVALVVLIRFLILQYAEFNQLRLNPITLYSGSHYDLDKYEVVFLGDSHALYWKINEINGIKCLNLGQHGETTQQLIYRVFNQLKGSPKVLVIVIGANDARCVASFPDLKDKIVDRAFENIIQIIKKHKKSEIVILTIPPIFRLPIKYYLFHFKKSIKALEELNSKIRKIQFDNVAILDAYKILSEYKRIGDISKDGIHLTKKGYQILEMYLKQLIIN